MAQKDNAKHQSSLSAEAESFVPSQPLLCSGGGGNQPVNQLPHYMTNCYPFVQGDVNNSMMRPGWQGGPGRPSHGQAGFPAHRLPHHPTGAYTFHGSRPPGPQVFPASHNMAARPPGLMPNLPPRQPINTANVPQPFLSHPPHHLASGASANFPPPTYPNPYQFPMGAPGPPAWPPGPYSGAQDSPGSFSQYSQGYYPYTASMESAEWNNSPRSGTEKKSKKKKIAEAGNMVSIGIQNESGVQHNAGHVPKKRPKTKTIICMDAAIQTDFSDEIANLTLAEKPSPLYNSSDRRGSGWRQYQDDTSTDSEEVDSDSGYSSPMHRRNQISNGTHPVVGMHMAPPLSQTGYLPMDNYGNPMHKHLGPLQHPFSNPPPSAAATAGGFAYPVMSSSTGINAMYNSSAYNLQNYPPPPHAPTIIGNVHIGPKIDNVNALCSVSAAPSQPAGGAAALTAPLKQQSMLSITSVKTEGEEDTEGVLSSSGTGGKKKRRRSRRKKRQSSQGDDVEALSDEPLSDLHRAHSSSNVSRTSTTENDVNLHFEDEDEFPGLMSAAGGCSSASGTTKSPVLSYSDILKSQVSPLSQDGSLSGSEHFIYQSQSARQSAEQSKESKTARKRRKRREIASRAADDELAEISIEQQMLAELGNKGTGRTASAKAQEQQKPTVVPEPTPPAPSKPAASSRVKSKTPIALNIADMISALEKQHEQQKEEKNVKKDKPVAQTVANILDSSAPIKRGKEREVPKAKKPSPLKKVILKEREEKKRLRLLEESSPLSPASSGSSQLVSVTGMPLDSDLSQDGVSSKASSLDFTGTTASADMSPISQTSPISMSPLSGSPQSSGVNSPIASAIMAAAAVCRGVAGDVQPSVLTRIHSRRFREYCNQVLDKEIDNCCTLLLQELVRFQDRLYHKDPIKAKAKRRIVLGLREVAKHLKLKKIRCVIISPNLERIQSKGGLDEALNKIIELCALQDVPCVFALGRRALGRACAKLVPVSVVGIFNFEGTEEHFHSLMALRQKAQEAYNDMVSILEQELSELPANIQEQVRAATNGNNSVLPQIFTHLGHSRTPSACSAISFTSSILSEPISENYPYSEPETDSRGYEIVRKDDVTKAVCTGEAVDQELDDLPADDTMGEDGQQESRSGTPSSCLSQGGKITIVEALNDIDEGHEADTEDDHTCGVKRRNVSQEVAPSTSFTEVLTEEEKDEPDRVDDLPHIDSIHSSVVDLSAEILSQHSTKTIDLNMEVLSTHSSKTLECGTGGQTTPDRLSRTMGSASDLRDAASSGAGGSGSAQRARTIDKERIESWVVETQRQTEKLSIQEQINEELEQELQDTDSCDEDDDVEMIQQLCDGKEMTNCHKERDTDLSHNNNLQDVQVNGLPDDKLRHPDTIRDLESITESVTKCHKVVESSISS